MNVKLGNTELPKSGYTALQCNAAVTCNFTCTDPASGGSHGCISRAIRHEHTGPLADFMSVTLACKALTFGKAVENPACCSVLAIQGQL